MKIWVDIINPSHALFFNSLLRDFDSEDISITVRDRAETYGLVKSSGMKDVVLVGKDYRSAFKKSFNTIFRTFRLASMLDKYDFGLSFENGMSVAVSKLKRKKSILLCDNDLKFFQSNTAFQDYETMVKSMAEYIIIPEACYHPFRNHVKDKRNVISYDGFKEDVYIANFKPDPDFKNQLPFDDYVVIRPESLGSFYVQGKQTLVGDLLKLFNKENVNVLYLPREKEDFDYVKGFSDVFIPDKPLNGLDLCYYADAVLTGSGTMAREAACLNRPSVSFFPGDNLLSVDKKLIDEKKVFHSRDPEKIVDYVLSNKDRVSGSFDLQKSKKVKNEVVEIINRIIHEN